MSKQLDDILAWSWIVDDTVRLYKSKNQVSTYKTGEKRVDNRYTNENYDGYEIKDWVYKVLEACLKSVQECHYVRKKEIHWFITALSEQQCFTNEISYVQWTRPRNCNP